MSGEDRSRICLFQNWRSPLLCCGLYGQYSFKVKDLFIPELKITTALLWIIWSVLFQGQGFVYSRIEGHHCFAVDYMVSTLSRSHSRIEDHHCFAVDYMVSTLSRSRICLFQNWRSPLLCCGHLIFFICRLVCAFSWLLCLRILMDMVSTLSRSRICLFQNWRSPLLCCGLYGQYSFKIIAAYFDCGEMLENYRLLFFLICHIP